MPFAWRTLACFDALEEKHKMNTDADVVKYSYTIKKFSNCRINFVNKNKDNPLILNNETVNDRGWIVAGKENSSLLRNYLSEMMLIFCLRNGMYSIKFPACYLCVFIVFILVNPLVECVLFRCPDLIFLHVNPPNCSLGL